MKKFVFFSGILFISISGLAQQKNRTQVSGKVTDAKTGEALAGASIILSETKVGTTTDSSGNYSIKNIPTGHTTIEVSYSGYQPIIDHLDMTGNDIRNFSLVSAIIEN